MSELAIKLIEKEKQEKTGKLDLGNCGLKTIPVKLFELIWLEELSLSNKIWDYNKEAWIQSPNSGSSNFINVEELPIEFKSLTKLKKLYFGWEFEEKWNLKICSILSSLGNLQTLDLNFNQISDISFLENLTGLQKLHLSNNKISDYSFLENLTGLQSLDLSDNEISDYSFLENLTGLQTLYLSDNKISDISFLENLTDLQSLDLSDNEISDYSFLENLTGLQSLDLSDNEISDYSFLENLTGLQTLYLSDNKISDISFLENLTGLQTLHLSDNEISDYSFLENLTGLQTLHLSNNKISDISFLENLTGLQTLHLRGNQISSISFLENLTCLQSLDLRGNQISDYSFLENLTGLQTLYLSDNKISNISFLENLTGLQSLDLRGIQISDYSFLENLTGLQSLDLSFNIISDYSFLENLTGLQSLDLRCNQISSISFLENLTGLQSLDLSDNEISDISFLENLTGLQTLHLSFNEISDYSFLENLTGLQTLYLSDNEISDISFLENLTGLQKLHLSANKISDISPLLPLLKSGISIAKDGSEGVIIGKNSLTNPPMSIVEEGRDAVINWFEQKKEQGEKPLFEAKLMILGQGDAGKTTFANLQLDPNYKVEPGKLDSTLGIVIYKGKEFEHQSYKKQKIKAHLWDFGGQVIQKMLHQFFITENCLYVLVSDKRAENTNFDYWFQIINLLGPHSSVIVLENPKDIQSVNEDFALAKYRELFKDLTIECNEVNLKDTRSNDKTRWKLLNETIEEKLSGLEIVNRPVPKKWSLIRDELDEQKNVKGKKYISKDEFHQICSKPEIDLTHEQCDLCLYYFHELGDLVYFDDIDLCTHIFLDHNWLTRGMYYILSDKQINENNGRFTRKQAYHQWGSYGYNEEEKAMLLRLILKDKFDICYELLHEKNVFITPLLLPNDKPATWEYETNLRFRFQYGFFPHGLFSRLIVQMHESIDAEMRWKTGVRLIDTIKGDTVRAEIQQFNDPEENQQIIDVKINGSKEGCKQLLSFVRAAVEKLHKDFKNISCKEIVACNCETCSGLLKKGEKPSFYDYKKLQSKIQNRSYFEECGKSNYTPVNIGKILSDVVIENAAIENNDSELLYKLKGMGMSINNIKNINKTEISDFGKATAISSSSSTAEATATNTISIEMQNILSETEMLKEDIEDERKLLQKAMDNDEIDVTIRDVEKAEKAIKDIEAAQKKNQEPTTTSKNRLKRFIDDLSDKQSSIHKALNLLRKGRDYGVGLAETYNKIAENIGMPSVPPLALDIIKKL
jgi:Leucine-rich repeat (LRR) protein